MVDRSNPAAHDPALGRRSQLAERLAGLTGEARTRVLAAAAVELETSFVSAVPQGISSELLKELPARTARALGVVPWRRVGTRLEVFAIDPFEREGLRDLAFALGTEPTVVVGDPQEIAVLLDRCYPPVDEPNARVSEPPADQSAAALAALAGKAPVVRFVGEILERAIAQNASDIHFEPFADALRIRCRLDGTLRDFARGSLDLALAATSRLKVLANLDVAERRRPQDGRIRATFAGREVDLRVSTLPTQDGESVVLRVLDPANAGRGLEALSMPPEVLGELRAVLARPSGLVVVTGPTGSGKTTTLYGCLRALNRGDLKILTAEDPVEYEIDGVTQLAVQPGIGLTFAEALRSFLRQDPDVVMVGEIRDLETAQIAVQAALTGHLVLTTLHTGDAPGAVARLIDLGVERYLVASTLEAVLAQRLVRRVCERCRGLVRASPQQLAGLGPEALHWRGQDFFEGRGCAACDGTGYRGRLGLFEWLRVEEGLRAMINESELATGLRAQAAVGGWRSLRSVGLAAAAAGHTTLAEVLRAT